ncbi:MAG: hypothetical protein NUW22_11495 [Acidobacteria bacterium]|nr:hypothetical protein [Acidobacteriota bacterium]
MSTVRQPGGPRVILASAAPVLYAALKALLESEYPLGGDDGVESDACYLKVVLDGYDALAQAEGRVP